MEGDWNKEYYKGRRFIERRLSSNFYKSWTDEHKELAYKQIVSAIDEASSFAKEMIASPNHYWQTPCLTWGIETLFQLYCYMEAFDEPVHKEEQVYAEDAAKKMDKWIDDNILGSNHIAYYKAQFDLVRNKYFHTLWDFDYRKK